MKKSFVFVIFIVLCATAFGQDEIQKAAADAAAAITQAQDKEVAVEKPRYWETSSEFNLGFNQTALLNWAAGGYNTLSLAIGIDAKANYAKDLTSWNNRLQLDYGFLWSSDKSNLLQKSNDRIYLESMFAYKTGANSKWNYTASLDVKTQFTNSYDNYQQDEETKKWNGTLKSGFFSPAYINLALGMEWKPVDWFSINLAPATGGVTIVSNEILRKTYGLKPISEEDEKYHQALFQFGAQIKANLKVSLNDVFSYETQLVLFTDYFNKPFNYNRINWDNKFNWQATKFFKIGLSTWLIYDPIVAITDSDGESRTSLVQFKEFLTLSFTYTITNKKN